MSRDRNFSLTDSGAQRGDVSSFRSLLPRWTPTEGDTNWTNEHESDCEFPHDFMPAVDQLVLERSGGNRLAETIPIVARPFHSWRFVSFASFVSLLVLVLAAKSNSTPGRVQRSGVQSRKRRPCKRPRLLLTQRRRNQNRAQLTVFSAELRSRPLDLWGCRPPASSHPAESARNAGRASHCP